MDSSHCLIGCLWHSAYKPNQCANFHIYCPNPNDLANADTITYAKSSTCNRIAHADSITDTKP